MKDASQTSLVANRLLNPKEESDYINELNQKYDQLRNNYPAQRHKLLPIEEARKNKLHLFD